jgi:trigger factor
MVPPLMQVSLSRISPVLIELSIDLPKESVASHVEKAYTNLSRKSHIRGYRPGKAPRSVLKQMFAGQVASDVANALVQESLPKALSEQNLTPINQPMVEIGKVSAEAQFNYKARFEVQPDLADVKFEGLELERPFAEVEDAAVDAEMEEIRKAHSRLEAPAAARAVKAGDVVTIDFEILVDGKTVKDAGGKGVPFEVSAGQALPELDAAVLGAEVGKTVTATTTFSANHPKKELQGKSGTFTITLVDLKEKVLPALDDELAKDVGSFQTIVELRANVHSRLEKANKDAAETAVAEQIILRLNELNPCEVPSSLTEAQAQLMQQELAMQIRRMQTRFTQEQAQKLVSQIRIDAEKKVRAGLVMASIAKAQEFKVTDEDMEKGLAELAEETGKNVAKLRVEYREKQKRDMLVGMILEDKILTFIEGKAKIKILAKGERPKLLADAEEAAKAAATT